MASSRKIGTNETTHTFGAAGHGRDYTSFATWEADTDIDLVSGAISYGLACYDDAASFDASFVVSGATTDSTHFRRIYAPDGQRHDGTENNGVTIHITGTNARIVIADDYSQLQDIIFTGLLDYFPYAIWLYGTSAMVGCILHDITRATSIASGVVLSNTSFVINCIVYNIQGDGIYSPSANGCIYNCTAHHCGGYGINGAVSAVAKNCIAHDNTIGNIHANIIQTTCVTSAPTYTDSGNDDYHLDTHDTVSINNGTDLSTDASYAFDDDIDFETRSGDWDIGFDECMNPAAVSRSALQYFWGI